ncbi:MAG: hypothetical protein DRO89_02110 [Candidatus Altiarchaeales archaeon]|nr:MAG: hypothetical protein DRO89_02110 [Candidatus Altiarchaeales archaeon]
MKIRPLPGSNLTEKSRGRKRPVILGVVNHEYAPTNYTIRVMWADELIGEIPIRLSHNETFERKFVFSARGNGTQKLRFLLYKEDLEEPYRTLHIIIDVSG